jgi:hypothetical protein
MSARSAHLLPKGEQTARLNVVPSAQGLERFDLDQGFHVITLNVGRDLGADSRQLMPLLTYSNVKFPIRLRDTAYIKLSIQQDSTNPVIIVSQNGFIRALRPGTAIVTGAFAGMTDELKVIVEGD